MIMLNSIKQCMTSKFVKITPDMPVFEASQLLVENDMPGAPVINSEGALVGWLSEQECLQVTIQVVYLNQRVATVKDVMTKEVVWASIKDDPLHLAQKMLKHKPKSYPVLDERNRVCGVITRKNLLSMLISKVPEFSRAC